MNQVPRGRGQLLLLAALFFGPIAAATLLYFAFPQLQPQQRTNYGELITPAKPLPALKLIDSEGKTDGVEVLHGRWTWLYLGGDNCPRSCTDKLFQMRQIRTLLNEKRQRVQRVYLAPSAADLAPLQAQLAAEHPDLKFYAEAPGAGVLPAFLAPVSPATADAQAIYLIDPRGNWLMVYPGSAESPGILKDIKKLLSLSVIG